jgi:hypothetical protein
LTSLSRWLWRVIIVLVPTLALAGILLTKEARAAGAFAIGKCGTYGEAYDYAGETGARAAALKQCKADASR